MRAALVVTSVERVRRTLNLMTGRLEPLRAGDASLSAMRTAALVSAAARRVKPGPSCLQRSLVLAGLLEAQEIHPVVRFGVRRREGAFEAHAWVECEGVPLADPDDVHREYSPLVPSGPARGGATP